MCALASSASADAGLSLLAHVGNLDGRSASTMAGDLELGITDDRWQYFGELAGGRAWIADEIAGITARAGIGVRWRARSLELGRNASLDMTLEAVTGVERYWWETGERRTRPDVGAGVGWQLRGHGFGTMRASARVVFAPSDPTLAVCRGDCPVRMSTTNAGLMAVIGFHR